MCYTSHNLNPKTYIKIKIGRCITKSHFKITIQYALFTVQEKSLTPKLFKRVQIKGHICLLYLGCVINLNYCFTSAND